MEYYSKDLDEHDSATVGACLELVKFGMCNQLLVFDGKYYMYDGDKEIEDRGLTIGGYESSWLADLAMSFCMENVDQGILNELRYIKIYRDDGLGVFDGEATDQQSVLEWINRFQGAINDLAGNDFLQFMADVWKPGAMECSRIGGKVTTTNTEFFPFLDMEIRWGAERKPEFGVHLKPNQQLKYLNRGSSHTPGCFKAIPNGVFNRLAKLMTVDDKNRDKKLDEIYPKHFEVLGKADLLQDVNIPTLKEKKDEIKRSKEDTVENRTKKRREKDRKRVIYFKIGFNNYWRRPVHKTIKEIKGKFESLNWLRVSMSYHRFPNLRELFQGDLNKKINRGLVSTDFKNLPCNCRNEAACPYKGKCRHPIVVYKDTCLTTGKIYIGNTQQHVKKRTQQHVQDVKKLVTDGTSSDSFAAHFATLVPKGTQKKEVKNFVKIKVDIIWQGDPISCVKTFGSRGCKLCSKERYEILKLTRNTPKMAINKCNEVHGACRHKPRFHRFDQSQIANTSTDESMKDERVFRPSSTTSVESSSSLNSVGSFSDRRVAACSVLTKS